MQTTIDLVGFGMERVAVKLVDTQLLRLFGDGVIIDPCQAPLVLRTHEPFAARDITGDVTVLTVFDFRQDACRPI